MRWGIEEKYGCVVTTDGRDEGWREIDMIPRTLERWMRRGSRVRTGISMVFGV